jgi:hypothetical protein
VVVVVVVVVVATTSVRTWNVRACVEQRRRRYKTPPQRVRWRPGRVSVRDGMRCAGDVGVHWGGGDAWRGMPADPHAKWMDEGTFSMRVFKRDMTPYDVTMHTASTKWSYFRKGDMGTESDEPRMEGVLGCGRWECLWGASTDPPTRARSPHHSHPTA